MGKVAPDPFVLGTDLVSTRVSGHIDIEQAQALKCAVHGLRIL